MLSMKVSTRKLARLIASVVVSALVLAGAVYAYFSVRVVPSISGVITDATSGHPIQGIKLCLEVDSRDFGYAAEHRSILRRDQLTTTASGHFSFRPSIHWMKPLSTWDGYAVRITDPSTGLAAACGPELALFEVNEDLRINLRRDGTQYFPSVLLHLGDASYQNVEWNSIRRPIQSQSTSIPLIPVLAGVEGCSNVKYSSLARDCQQMMAEVVAFKPSK